MPVLFLGEWCRRYSRKERWDRMNAEVLPYHWDDRAKLHKDYLYLRDFYERLLPLLGEKLNEVHGVDHTTRYWRILLGPWLGYFIQMLFDRWTSIHQAVEQYELSGTTTLNFSEEMIVPVSMMNFNEYFVGDEWNHHLYSQIVVQSTSIKVNEKQVSTSYSPLINATENDEKIRHKIKKKMALSLFRFLSRLSREDDAVFVATYLPYLKQWLLDCKFAQIPQVRVGLPIIPVKYDPASRDWFVQAETKSDFEHFSGMMLARQIPVVYLEGYQVLVQQVANNGWPGRPKIIWTSNAENSDDHFKAYAAEKVENGTPLVMGQHGGHYGTGLWSFTEDHHLAIADRYLSWGWTDRQYPKIVPVGQLKCKSPSQCNRRSRERLLLVTSTLPRYSYYMYSAIVARQWLDYFDDQCNFVGSLPPAIQKSLTVRLYMHDYGWDQHARWRDRFPALELDEGRGRIDHLIDKSRLYVSTYNATTYLETFAMNVPTLIFWNPKHWELRDSAKPYFAELKSVGIFHDTPESAAHHVAAIWNDTEGWWSSIEVQRAREHFIHRFALTNNLLSRVESSLRQVIQESQAEICELP